jgi:segregation and condensation protein B
MNNEINLLKSTIEVALLAAGKPLTIEKLCDLFIRTEEINESKEITQERADIRLEIRKILKILAKDCDERGIELIKVASGYRFQVKSTIAKSVSNLWATRPARYSNAMLETLALVAYRQPVTRGEIENIRGVSVSTQIIKNLLEYGWVRIVGHRKTAGRPMLYGTTKDFLDHFNLNNIDELPPLAELQQIAQNNAKDLIL